MAVADREAAYPHGEQGGQAGADENRDGHDLADRISEKLKHVVAFLRP